jgi:hypothetical protein
MKAPLNKERYKRFMQHEKAILFAEMQNMKIKLDVLDK